MQIQDTRWQYKLYWFAIGLCINIRSTEATLETGCSYIINVRAFTRTPYKCFMKTNTFQRTNIQSIETP